MRKSAKIAIALLLGFGCLLFLAVGALATGIYYALDFQKGRQLYSEGYWAEDRGDYYVAIAKLSEALRHNLTKDDRATVYSRRGWTFRETRRFDEAIRDFSEAIRLYPRWSHAYFWRGWSYQSKGEPDKAIQDFTEAIRNDENSGWAYYDRGLLYLRRQQWDLAIKDFDEAVRCLPGEDSPLQARGQSYFGKKDLDRALASFDGAVSINGNDWSNYLYRSNVYFAKGDSEKHLRDHREAQRLKAEAEKHRSGRAPFVPSNYSQVYRELTEARKKGDQDRSIERANRLIAMEINWRYASPVLMDRGNAFRAKGDLDRAMVDYDQAIAFDPNNAGAYVDRGLLLSEKGEHSEARKDFGEALRLNPNQWEAYYDRGADFRDERQLEEAIADFSRAIELNSTFPRSYVTRAGVYAMKGEVDCALSDYEKALKLNPNLADVYLAQARIHSQRRDYGEAAHDLEKAEAATEKISARTLNSIAWMQATSLESSLRNGEKAVEAAKKACELTTWKNWAYIDTLAAAYAEAGDFERAVQCQEKAIALAPPSYSRIQHFRERLTLYRGGIRYREPID